MIRTVTFYELAPHFSPQLSVKKICTENSTSTGPPTAWKKWDSSEYFSGSESSDDVILRFPLAPRPTQQPLRHRATSRFAEREV